jgi:hypothetical protein
MFLFVQSLLDGSRESLLAIQDRYFLCYEYTLVLTLLIFQILRQWAKFNYLLKSCFPTTSSDKEAAVDWKLEDLLNGNSPSLPSASISPVASPPSFIVIFPVGGKEHSVTISVLENGEIDLDVDEHFKERACVLIENAGIGVGIEFLMKELLHSN